VEGVRFPKGQNSEDIMYTTKAFCKLKKAVYIDACLYHYVIDRKDSIMNENKNERMFKDELPFWREHIGFIRSNVSENMADLAAYYYYRRLLSYYINMVDKNPAGACKISNIVKKDKGEISRIYSNNNMVSRGDRARMKLFLFNNGIYRVFNSGYDKLIVAAKNKYRRK
jgi:hypothetical protein